MKRLGVIANCRKAQATAALERLAGAAAARGLSLAADEETAALLPSADPVPASGWASKVDVLMALGGDGTMLSAVRSLAGADIPVIGVNLGSLGFMTSVTEDDLEKAVDALVEDTYTLSNRSMVLCRVLRNGTELAEYTALNDVVLGWGTSPRVITMGVEIDGEEVTSYVCDGLILSTPTGSTGHSLSAMGPVVHPESPVLVLNVICPHTLSNRPLVIPDDKTVTITLEDVPENKTLTLSTDGQSDMLLEVGDRLVVEKHPKGVRFLHPPGYSYFSVLRQKLRWGGSSV